MSSHLTWTSLSFFLVLFATGCTNSPNKRPSAGLDGSNGMGDPQAPPPQLTFDKGVTIRLTQTFTSPKKISFGLPLARGVLKSPSDVQVRIAGNAVAADITELLPDLDVDGMRVGVRALRIQFSPSLVHATNPTDVEVLWTGGTAPATPPEVLPFQSDDISAVSPSVVATATRTIQKTGSTYQLVETSREDKTVFVGREPRVLATYPDGYLGFTGILGPVVSSAEVVQRADLAGIAFLSTQMVAFLRSAMYDEPYAVSPDPDSLPDFSVQYEAWLYDRCATFLLAYVHSGDSKFLRHALRTCSNYSANIQLAGANRGTFKGKPDPDTKYSHSRGLFAYYALTADEAAANAIQAISELWLKDSTFVAPYRAGRLRGIDKLWTERLLGTSLEGLLYGYRLLGDVSYLTAFQEMVATAYKHLSGDQATLDAINPGAGFPPQNCFIHSAAQHGEGSASVPWCSSWMSELTLDALLQWYDISKDSRVPEIFVRLTRFLRDTGAVYFRGNPAADSFLQPSICFSPKDSENPRRLVPLYGAGIDKSGKRVRSGEYEDYEHCTDASALAAAGRWGLAMGAQAKTPPAPFAKEETSFSTLHDEFLFCSQATFREETRASRNPNSWTSAQLAGGAGDPAAFIKAQKIGYPQHQVSPLRKIGWWFNMSVLQFGLMSNAKIAIPSIAPGTIQPKTCP